MSIIITGLEMPTERESFKLTIKYNGTILDTETGMQVAEAHELPTHGRLIDADALRTLYEKWHSEEQLGVDIDDCHVPIPVIRQNIDDAPTVIPASKESET